MSDNELEKQVAGLASEHAHEQETAVAWLLKHPERSRSALRRLAQAGQLDQPTRGAIYILGQMGEEVDVPILADLLLRADSGLRLESAQALGQHPSQSSEQILIKALQNNRPDVVGAAAIALGVRGHEAARRSLEDLLGHVDELVRYRAVYALRKLGIAPSVSRLRAHYEHEPSADVRQIIEESLKQG